MWIDVRSFVRSVSQFHFLCRFRKKGVQKGRKRITEKKPNTHSCISIVDFLFKYKPKMGIDQQKKGKIRFLFVILIVLIGIITAMTMTISLYLASPSFIGLICLFFLFIYFVEVVHNGTQLLLPVCIAIKS